MRVPAILRLRGRLARGGFFLRVLAIVAVFAVLDAGLEPLLGGARAWVLNPVALWLLVAALAQRLHDRGRSARWMLVAVVPIVGALWLLWQCCRAGVPDDNRWGRDPQRPQGDFLVVGG